MANINLYNLTVPAYWNLIRIFILFLNGEDTKKTPKRFTIGGSRKGGKTRAVFIMFAILYALAFPETMVIIAVKKGSQRLEIQNQLRDFMYKLLKVKSKVTKDIEDNITFNNGSVINIRSLKQSGSKEIALKGLVRPTDLKNAIIINEECNSWKKSWFGIVREAVVAENLLTFNLFNTDHIKQYIVGRLQKYLPQNEAIMKSKGNQVTIQEVNGVMEYFQRTNTLVTWDVLPEAIKNQIIADDLDDPKRGRVARWGLNGTDGKALYYNLYNRHFINSSRISKYERFYKLPHQLFVKYRIGVDEGHAQDKFAVTLFGITAQRRAIRIGKIVFTPPENKDLDVNVISNQSYLQILAWRDQYPNMYDRMTNIRVEYAGAGAVVFQNLEKLMKGSKMNYTVDKAKKNIDGKTKKRVGSNKDTQPELEARASIKNLLFGRNQILFWNADEETYLEYTGRSRDEDQLIVDGDDHEGDADDYALIPEYKDMIDNPPKMSFAEELDTIIKKYNL